MKQRAGIAVITLLVIVLACSLLYRHQREFGSNCADDAYISFRYAENLASGKGLVYNVGNRVEGFSNPLWTFTLAAYAALGYKLEFVARALGFFFSYLALALSILLARRLSGSNVVAPLAAALMLTGSTSFLLYSISGFETAQYATVLALCAYLATFKSPIARALALLVGSLAAISRPEGVLVTLMLWAVSILWLLKSDKSQRIKVGAGLILSVTVFLGFFIFRYFYFGDINPNTYYAKTPNWLVVPESVSDVRVGILNTDTGFHGGLLLAVLAVGAAAMSFSYGWIVSAGIVVCGLAFLYYAGVDWMPFARFFAPYHPVLCAASVASIFVLFNRGSIHVAPLLFEENGSDAQPLRAASSSEENVRAPSFNKKLACALLALMMGYLPQVFFKLDVKNFNQKILKYPYNLVSGHFVKYVGKSLNKLLAGFEPYSVSVVAKRIGAVGYFSRVKIEDPFGLVDKSIARVYYRYRDSTDVSDRADEIANLVINRAPEIVLIFAEEPLENPEDIKDSSKRLDLLQRRILKAAYAKHYYFAREFRRGELAAYLYLRPDFELPQPQ